LQLLLLGEPAIPSRTKLKRGAARRPRVSSALATGKRCNGQPPQGRGHGRSTRSDNTPREDDLRQQAHETTNDAEQAKDKTADKAGDAKDELSKVGHRISDAVEDVIPGDSDADGH